MNLLYQKLKVINLQKVELKKDHFIAKETIDYSNEYLKKKEQVLFFLNRRGYSPFLICKKCGFKHLCSSCSIYLTYHKSINKLICIIVDKVELKLFQEVEK